MANLMMHSTCLFVTVLESFYTKNLEKVGEIMNIQEYSGKFQHFSSFLNVCFHLNTSAIKYLSTEKTIQNEHKLGCIIFVARLTYEKNKFIIIGIKINIEQSKAKNIQ